MRRRQMPMLRQIKLFSQYLSEVTKVKIFPALSAD